jgi:hypothetical protein
LSESRTIPASTPRAALVVGHPGHELRIYGWMIAARPIVHVLTDGSGAVGASRVGSTTALLQDVGASRGSVYARLSDREIYAAMLAGHHDQFIAIAEELADSFVRDRIELVAGDAVEGFNPSHDVCRYVINAAVRLASTTTGRQIACYAFPLDSAPGVRPDRLLDRPLTVRLDDGTLERKLRAAGAYTELKGEVEQALKRFGPEPFRTEHLWPVDLTDRYCWDPARVPFYESYGAQRVASGAYSNVVTFGQHVRPLADALWVRCAVAV